MPSFVYVWSVVSEELNRTYIGTDIALLYVLDFCNLLTSLLIVLLVHIFIAKM